MLNCAGDWVAALAGDGHRIPIPASSITDGVLYFLVTTAVAGLAVCAVCCQDLIEGVSLMGMTSDGTIGGHAQHVVACIGIMSGDGRVTGCAEVDSVGFWHIIVSSASDQSDWWFGRGVTGVAFLSIMEAV